MTGYRIGMCAALLSCFGTAALRAANVYDDDGDGYLDTVYADGENGFSMEHTFWGDDASWEFNTRSGFNYVVQGDYEDISSIVFGDGWSWNDCIIGDAWQYSEYHLVEFGGPSTLLGNPYELVNPIFANLGQQALQKVTAGIKAAIDSFEIELKWPSTTPHTGGAQAIMWPTGTAPTIANVTVLGVTGTLNTNGEWGLNVPSSIIPGVPGDWEFGIVFSDECPEDVRFIETTGNSGFSEAPIAPYLLVPLDAYGNKNTAKAVIPSSSPFHDLGVRFDFDIEEPGYFTLSPDHITSNEQTVTFTASSKGYSSVEVLGCPVLDVSVKDKKIQTVALHFVEDAAGHSTVRTPAEASAIIDFLNSIYYKQSNVFFALFSSESISVEGDWGDYVEWINSSSAEYTNLISEGSIVADYNLYFVWGSKAGTATGVTLVTGAAFPSSGHAMISDLSMNSNCTAAHEIGHLLGLTLHDPDPKAIMYKSYNSERAKLFWYDVEIINP